ncbi:thioredoxin family protein [Candidatus Vallotia tarda]|uniref:Thioredoxin family protein n=1 Tax=Candidatus Vallotiella hemipterorum TaxID=1177213 RepID=A0A916JQM3_9BURK|nr:thioredoxin family protein [Candidatus Vallotia tarda]CAG7595022.1 Thioredoxin family protein [Candidatus Vallotia tarda]
MPALNIDNDAELITMRLSSADTLFVACLCAEWCGSCREYRTGFDGLADAHPEVCFVWIDIETHADWLDDFDVENFPTILIENSIATRFFGTVLPYPPIIARMLVDLSQLPSITHAPKLRPVLVNGVSNAT